MGSAAKYFVPFMLQLTCLLVAVRIASAAGAEDLASNAVFDHREGDRHKGVLPVSFEDVDGGEQVQEDHHATSDTSSKKKAQESKRYMLLSAAASSVALIFLAFWCFRRINDSPSRPRGLSAGSGPGKSGPETPTSKSVSCVDVSLRFHAKQMPG